MQNARPATTTADENLEVASGERRLETAKDSGGTKDTRATQNPVAVGSSAVSGGGKRGRSG